MKKRLLALLFAASLSLCSMGAFAQDMGVVSIPSTEEETEEETTETEAASLGDLKVHDEVDIEGFGTLTVRSFTLADSLPNYDGYWRAKINSGDEADYALLMVDVLNTNTSPTQYLTEFSVRATYSDKYEYQGWAYQQDRTSSGEYDALTNAGYDYGEEVIQPLYNGYYVFGCTLPNAVVEGVQNGDAPLRLEINFDGNEIVFNVDKDILDALAAEAETEK